MIILGKRKTRMEPVDRVRQGPIVLLPARNLTRLARKQI